MLNRFLEKPKITSLGPEISEKVFSLLKVSPEENDNLRIMDSVPEDDLVLIHYLDVNAKVKDVRGIVIDTEARKVVARSFPFTEEYTTDFDLSDLPLNENCQITRAREGTIIRLFQGKNTKRWYMSTHKKINGYRSRWSGLTFGEMFESVWGNAKFEDYLKSGYCYVFLLSHADNRLVCRVKEPCLYHVQTFDPDMKVVFEGLKKPHPHVKDRDVIQSAAKDLTQLAENLNWETHSGLLITEYQNQEIVNCWKITPVEYNLKRDIRGNEPNLRLRYYELRQTPNIFTTQDIRNLFPEKTSVFDEAEKQLKKVLPFLAEKYSSRYREGQFYMLPKEVHIVLERTLQKYDPRIKLEDNIRNSLNECTGHQLNAVIRFMIQEKRLLAESKTCKE